MRHQKFLSILWSSGKKISIVILDLYFVPLIEIRQMQNFRNILVFLFGLLYSVSTCYVCYTCF